MTDPSKLIENAKTSSFSRALLSRMLGYIIPFNKPHRFRIVLLTDDKIVVTLPFIKRNLNHIGGLHACALATLSEFTSGLLLIAKLGMKSYRLILQKLVMDYHYQGKLAALAEFELTEEWMRENVINALATQDKITVECHVKIHDTKGNHLTSGLAVWQIKSWKQVRTKAA